MAEQSFLYFPGPFLSRLLGILLTLLDAIYEVSPKECRVPVCP